MRPNGFGVALSALAGLLLAGLLLAGCSAEKPPPTILLSTRDFIADPGTIPTDVPPAPPADAPPGDAPPGDAAPGPSPAAAPTLSAEAASGGVFDVVARPEAPIPVASAAPAGAPVLIDQKVGEINGRPIRAREVLDEDLGQRLEIAARTRRLSAADWAALAGRPEPRAEARVLTREEWLRFSGGQIELKLRGLLENEILEAEARASLKPQEKQGLQYLLQEWSDNLRRTEGGGSRAAAERHLLETEKMTAQQWLRSRESLMLIEHQLREQIHKRVRVSWKDVRLYYERNADLYNPPPVARFRLIRVPSQNAEAVSAVESALSRGEPFETVAAMPENIHYPELGGFLGDKPFTGDYATTDFNFPLTLEDAAHRLAPGQFTPTPLDMAGDKVWLFLESITRTSRPLSSRDVQLEILRKLTNDATEAEFRGYIDRLKDRASFTDFEAMARELMDVAAARYWPEG